MEYIITGHNTLFSKKKRQTSTLDGASWFHGWYPEMRLVETYTRILHVVFTLHKQTLKARNIVWFGLWPRPRQRAMKKNCSHCVERWGIRTYIQTPLDIIFHTFVGMQVSNIII
jgi:hypothetical protein